MRTPWLPVSAALLVTGAMALVFATVVASGNGDPDQTAHLVQSEDARWLAGR